MNQSLKCFLGMHNYKIIDVLDFPDDEFLKKIYIIRCIHCGKIRYIKVKTNSIF